MADQEYPVDLKTGVQRMIDAGESEENIATAIQQYKQRTSQTPEVLDKAMARASDWRSSFTDPAILGSLKDMAGGAVESLKSLNPLNLITAAVAQNRKQQNAENEYAINRAQGDPQAVQKLVDAQTPTRVPIGDTLRTLQDPHAAARAIGGLTAQTMAGAVIPEVPGILKTAAEMRVSPEGVAAFGKTLANDIPVVRKFGPAVKAYQEAAMTPEAREAAQIADAIAAKQKANRIKTAVDAAVPRAGTLKTVKPPPTPAEQMGLSPTATGNVMESFPETPAPEPARTPDDSRAQYTNLEADRAAEAETRRQALEAELNPPRTPVKAPPVKWRDEPAAAAPVPAPPLRWQEEAQGAAQRPVPAPPVKWRGEPPEAAGEPPAAPPPVTEPPPAAEPPAKTDEELSRGQQGARDEGRETGKTTEEVRATSRNRFTGETGVKSGLPLQVKTRLHAFADDAMARNASPQEYIDYVNAGREPDRIQIGQALESYVMGKGRPSPFPVLAGAAVGGGALLRKALVDQLGGQDQEQEQ
jgi:hypothetical protein